MNEIKRLQQLAGINEIKINNPNPLDKLKRGLERVLLGDKEFADEEQKEDIDGYITAIYKDDLDEDGLRSLIGDYLFNDREMIQDYIDMAMEKSNSPFLKEIKVNKPGIEFPIILNNIKELVYNTNRLQALGYKWIYHNYELSDITEGDFPAIIKQPTTEFLNIKDFFIHFNQD